MLDRQVDGMSYEQLLSLGELGGHVSKGAKADALQVGCPMLMTGSPLKTSLATPGSLRSPGCPQALPERAYGSQEHPAGAEGEQCAVCCMGEGAR